MEFTQLGTTDLRVSRICLGIMSYGTTNWREWVLDETAGRTFIKRALESGINFFDTADTYSFGASEEILGRALKDFAKREDVIIATKVFFPTSPGSTDMGLSRGRILRCIDESLRRLQTDHVDLYQIHRWDPNTPIEETMGALDECVRRGKTRYIGASSMYAYQFSKALHVAEKAGTAKFVSMQNQYNLIYREEEREMIPLCLEEKIGLIPWSPLARGFLTGSRKRGSQSSTLREETDAYAKKLYYQEADYQIADRVVELAARRNLKPAQIALAWLLHREGVTSPIIGATKMNHLEDAVGAVGVRLTSDEIKLLEEKYIPHAVLDHD
jgi:aryl-alcohol dehydrogenase (NADP+)